MHLDCYKIYDVAPQLVPARSNRDWMDAFTDRHPYRCLPLTMANSTGWELLFEKDEPFAFITLMEHKKLEEVQPERKLLRSNEDLVKEYNAWSESRADFNKRLKGGEENAMKERWQRHYMRGEKPTGDKADAHQTKRRLKAPKDV